MDRLETFGHLRDVDPDAKRVTAVISTGDIARDGAIIDPKGWVFDNYQHNPVILWQHDANAMPFARTVDLQAGEKELLARAEFDLDDPVGAAVFRKIEAGYINATSVRWLPLETEVKKTGEGKAAREVLIFKRQELLEWSFVTIPADPKALIMRADGGAVDLLDFIGEADDPERPYPNEHACRLRDPSDFQPDSFRRVRREHKGKSYDCIMGRLKGESTMTEQAYRYPKDDWEAATAKAHCEEHKGNFEPAASQAADNGCEGGDWEDTQATVSGPDLKPISDRLITYLAQRLERPSIDELIVVGLSKATGKTEERIRQELAEGGLK